MKTKKLSHPARQVATRTQQERCCAVAKNLLRHLGLKPELIDVFSKKQKQFLFGIIFDYPVIRAEKEKSIPRHFLDNIRRQLIEYMKVRYFDDPADTITYIDLATCGMGFIMAFWDYESKFQWVAATPAQLEAARQIKEKIGDIEAYYHEKGFARVFSMLYYLTRCYSQVNFRNYGFKYTWEASGIAAMRMKIELTSQDCVTKMFTHNGVKRRAFRLPFTDNSVYEPGWATVRRKRIFPRAKENEVLNIYIQSHVLHRYKERVDIFEATDRNFFLQSSLTLRQKVVVSDRQTFLECSVDSCPIGYFTFFVSGDDIVLKTFIPLLGEGTPESRKLHEMLPLEKDDIKYLGMDKLSFFADIDFEQIPSLKQALIDSGIWKVKEMIDGAFVKAYSIDMNKTMFVKKYFDKIMESFPQMPESELESESLF
ncbi:MAG: hypothetical protein LBE79_07165 [Tannerella sp.]|jgi:hypothetical protein|nr:hypothetical protein [Tannerella sp.]